MLETNRLPLHELMLRRILLNEQIQNRISWKCNSSRNICRDHRWNVLVEIIYFHMMERSSDTHRIHQFFVSTSQ